LEDFVGAKFYWQLAHVDQAEDATVLLTGMQNNLQMWWMAVCCSTAWSKQRGRL